MDSQNKLNDDITLPMKRTADEVYSQDSATPSTSYNGEAALSPTQDCDSPSIAGKSSEESAEGPPAKVARTRSIASPTISDEDTDATIQSNEEDTIEQAKLKEATKTNVSSERNATIKRQIEYYFSDDNLKHDKFFRGIMESAPEPYKNSLDMKSILNCPRIKKMDTNQEEILKALEGSHVIISMDESKQAWLSRAEALPLFEEKKSHPPYLRKKSPTDYHLAGPLVKVKNIPEEVSSWIAIKNSIQAILPQEAVIKFVTEIKNSGFCHIWIKPFANFREKINQMECTVEGAKISLELMNDEQAIKNFINVEMPLRVRKQREKLIARTRSKLVQQPLKLAGQTFNSVEHLKKCVFELLHKTPENSYLKSDSNAEKVVIALLEYHPNPQLKLSTENENFGGLKVIPASQNEQKNTKKMFAIIKKDQDQVHETSFRIDKCLSEISRNPPVISEDETEGA